MDIGERLKLIGKTLKLQKQEMAKQAGIHRSFFYTVSTGKQSISFDFLEKICITYNISADWLLFGEGKMFRQNSEPSPPLDPEVERENKILSKANKETKKQYMDMIEALMTLPTSQQKNILKSVEFTLLAIIEEKKKKDI